MRLRSHWDPITPTTFPWIAFPLITLETQRLLPLAQTDHRCSGLHFTAAMPQHVQWSTSSHAASIDLQFSVNCKIHCDVPSPTAGSGRRLSGRVGAAPHRAPLKAHSLEGAASKASRVSVEGTDGPRKTTIVSFDCLFYTSCH
ncbi:hypothetical protein EYF80_029641 [Liparis tanakae]|uniref:Uncharacterized protein n=1 Tax=Liparis tanakae TaxID=230148 RepID=A0A4Z2H2U4_9TELE|nr:hypothetical protein EYF80_029641 [Liparis tanakae]